MADFNFPPAPIPNQEHIEGSTTYVWNGYGWAIKVEPAPPSEGGGSLQGLAYDGMQVNGAMEVNQLMGVEPTAPGRHLDCWSVWSVGAQVITVQQAAAAPPGLLASLKVAVTTPNLGPTATDTVIVNQPIEGHRVSRLAWGTSAAQPVTIGFWANATRTGTFSGSARNAAADRSCTFSYIINAVNTWEFKVVTIPGDTAGTWVKDNGVGLDLSFAAMAGDGVTAAPGVWGAGSFVAAPGQVNCVADATDVFMITGILVLPGIVAPTAEQAPLIMRPSPQELELCKRYWRKLAQVNISGYGSGGNGQVTYVPLSPAMRIPPVVTLSNPGASNSSPVSVNVAFSDVILFQAASTAAGGFYAYADATCDARL